MAQKSPQEKDVAMQEFLRVYNVLRDELLNDEIIAGQPTFAKEHLKKVMLNLPITLTITQSTL